MLLQRAGQCERDQLGGLKDSVGNGTVMWVVAPRQHMSWGNYHISADALAEAVH